MLGITVTGFELIGIFLHTQRINLLILNLNIQCILRCKRLSMLGKISPVGDDEIALSVQP